jgi:hypothetical protein
MTCGLNSITAIHHNGRNEAVTIEASALLTANEMTNAEDRMNESDSDV